MSNPVLTEETLKELEELIDKANSDHYYQLEAAWQLKCAAPELLRLAKLGISAEVNIKNLIEHFNKHDNLGDRKGSPPPPIPVKDRKP